MLHAAIGSFNISLADGLQAQISGERHSASMWRCCRSQKTFASHALSVSGRACRPQPVQRCRPQHNTVSASAGNCGNVSDLAGGGSSLPQPQACNAGQNSSAPSPWQPSAEANSSDTKQSNGTTTHSRTPSTDEVQQLRQEVSQLSKTVTAQAKALQEQMLAVQQANQMIDIKTAGTAFRPSSPSQQSGWNKDVKPFEVQRNAIGDRRYLGGYDARFHSTNMGATPQDHRILPRRIILVRHAESEGNIDNFAYTYVPDPQVPLTLTGMQQAEEAGRKIKAAMDGDSQPYNLYFYTSPYKRSRQTYDSLCGVFDDKQLKGVQEEVQLREQDFGNFQDAEGKQKEKAERLRFGRFFYRFPNGESGADVYDRMTIFEDHMIRDINAGRFRDNTSLVLLTHGLALRVFLMRWFHWTVDQFMNVYNPPNAEPLILERIPDLPSSRAGGPVAWIHTKALYRLTQESRDIIQGCTDEMCSTSHSSHGLEPL